MIVARSYWRWWALAGAIACIIIGGWLGLRWLAGNSLLGDEQNNLTKAQIESIGRIKLPPGASGVQARAGGFQDRFIFIRFEIAPTDLELFLKSSRYTPAIGPAQQVPFQSIAPDAPWWRPQDAMRFEAGTHFVDGISQSVLVDMTSVDDYIVYVQTFET